jgi:hypothetical protein
MTTVSPITQVSESSTSQNPLSPLVLHTRRPSFYTAATDTEDESQREYSISSISSRFSLGSQISLGDEEEEEED